MAPAHRDGPAIVTGGAGAIGSAAVRALLARGVEVCAIDSLVGGRKEHLPHGAEAARFSFVESDVREPTAYQERFRGAAEIWHLAANPDIRRGTSDPRVDLENGTVATFHVLECARRHDVPRFFFSSSSAVYGLPTVFPTPESYGPLEPRSLYGGHKLAAEGMVAAYAHSYGLTAFVFRFANIIGPGMTHGVLIDFFDKLRRDPTTLEVLGDGHQAKSYLRTDECVEGMLVAGDRATDRVNVFNLGTTDRISVREIAEKVIAAHGGRARIAYTGGEVGWVGDVPQQLLAIDKIGHLGWHPKLTSAQAIDRTITEIADARKCAR
ncbi:MAG TPA: NAD-dependent epimerase/dehydratase family protein [Thermoplasmata archaeon]|nr:NAD-dependent epimerase/dehydratase family protein [Thermoplasmata archaeon]